MAAHLAAAEHATWQAPAPAPCFYHVCKVGGKVMPPAALTVSKRTGPFTPAACRTARMAAHLAAAENATWQALAPPLASTMCAGSKRRQDAWQRQHAVGPARAATWQWAQAVGAGLIGNGRSTVAAPCLRRGSLLGGERVTARGLGERGQIVEDTESVTAADCWASRGMLGQHGQRQCWR